MKIVHLHKQHLKEDPSPSAEVTVDIPPSRYIDDLGLFDDKKEYVKWLFRLEKLIRDSYEYVAMMKFSKKRRGLNHCGVHRNLSSDEGYRLELHHTPFTLFDIVSCVVTRRFRLGDSLKMQDIAHEVMELHYLELVGLYPLCMICHALIHSDSVDDFFIPIEDCSGRDGIPEFAKMYRPYMSDALANKWENIKTLNLGYTFIHNTLPMELQKKYLYVKPAKKAPDMISTSKLANFINSLDNYSYNLNLLHNPKKSVILGDDGFYRIGDLVSA